MNSQADDLRRAIAMDGQDPLAHKRQEFELPSDVIYLDGNSLGALPKTVAARMHQAVTQEWGHGLIRSWNDAGWYPLARRVGAQIASLVGAQPQEVAACDSTTVNLFKLIAAACGAMPDRGVLILEEGNFPTDAYVGQGVAQLFGKRVVLAHQDNIAQQIAQVGKDLCAVQLTQVHYKTGRMLDMASITAQVHAQGGRMIWDLAHSAGALHVQLNACNVDYAVGCGYKYLNGGPGAPAFAYVREDLHASLAQPLQGWFGHAAPFHFEQGWRPAQGIDRLLVGTTSVLGMTALSEALKVWESVDLRQMRAKSEAMTHWFIELFDAHIAPHGPTLATPRQAAERGSQVSFMHPEGYAIMQALIARGVIGDFRAPDILRFGFAPLYVSYQDCLHAIEILADILATGQWKQAQFAQKKAVT